MPAPKVKYSKNPLSFNYAKATVGGAVAAAATLINGRIPEDFRLDGDEMSLLLLILGYLVVRWTGNTPGKAEGDSKPTLGIGA